MFARNVSIRLKPNTIAEFTTTFENSIVPMLRQQPGFRDEFALVSEDSTHVAAISLWDSKEQADTYNAKVYPEVLKLIEMTMDGAPKVRVSNVISSASQPTLAVPAAAKV